MKLMRYYARPHMKYLQFRIWYEPHTGFRVESGRTASGRWSILRRIPTEVIADHRYRPFYQRPITRGRIRTFGKVLAK